MYDYRLNTMVAFKDIVAILGLKEVREELHALLDVIEFIVL